MFKKRQKNKAGNAAAFSAKAKYPPLPTVRQARILAAIVKEYSEKAEPVGSEDLQNKYGLDVSSATIRNEMAALEKLGYIEQPHTSAGRVPTDLGYRYFINELMQRFEMSVREQKFIREQLVRLQRQNQEIGRHIAKLLAEHTDQAAFALLPDEISTTGISNILQQPNMDKTGIVEVVQFFENIDEYSDKILTKFFAEKPEALIGKEHHLPHISNYSLIVSKVNLPSGKNGLIGILGPKSMRYDKNMNIVEYVAKFLSGGFLLALLMIKF